MLIVLSYYPKQEYFCMERHVIILVHGIRTFGGWQDRLAALLRKHGAKTEIHIYKYSYLGSFAFLIPFLRRHVLKEFEQYLRDNVEGWKDAKVDIVAHSFGTYVVGIVLKRLIGTLALRINTIIFCGSVLKQTFRWSDLLRSGAVERLENHCGVRDLWPVVAQLCVLGMGIAGRHGFVGPTGLDTGVINRYYAVDHGGFFTAEFMETNWVPLLLCSGTSSGEELFPPRRWWGVGMETYVEPVKLSFLLLLVGIPAFGFYIQRMEIAEERSLKLVAEANRIMFQSPHAALLLSAEATAAGGHKAKESGKATARNALAVIKKRQEIRKPENWPAGRFSYIAPTWYEGSVIARYRSNARYGSDLRYLLLTTERGSGHNRPPGEVLLLDTETLETRILDIGPVWELKGLGPGTSITFTVKANLGNMDIGFTGSVQSVGRILQIRDNANTQVVLTVDNDGFWTSESLVQNVVSVVPGGTVTFEVKAGYHSLVFYDKKQAVTAFNFGRWEKAFDTFNDRPLRSDDGKRRLEYAGFSGTGKNIYVARQYNIEMYSHLGVLRKIWQTGGGCTKYPITVVGSLLNDTVVIYGDAANGVYALDSESGRCLSIHVRGQWKRLLSVGFETSPSQTKAVMLFRNGEVGIIRGRESDKDVSIEFLPIASVTTATFRHADEKDTLLTAQENGKITLWLITDASLIRDRTYSVEGSPVEFADFTEDGQRIIVVNKNGATQAIDVESGRIYANPL
jgi:hypothetical protein